MLVGGGTAHRLADKLCARQRSGPLTPQRWRGGEGVEEGTGVRHTSPHPRRVCSAGEGPENKGGVSEKSCPTSSGLWATPAGRPGHRAAVEGGHSSAARRHLDTKKAKAARAPH